MKANNETRRHAQSSSVRRFEMIDDAVAKLPSLQQEGVCLDNIGEGKGQRLLLPGLILPKYDLQPVSAHVQSWSLAEAEPQTLKLRLHWAELGCVTHAWTDCHEEARLNHEIYALIALFVLIHVA